MGSFGDAGKVQANHGRVVDVLRDINNAEKTAMPAGIEPAKPLRARRGRRMPA